MKKDKIVIGILIWIVLATSYLVYDQAEEYSNYETTKAHVSNESTDEEYINVINSLPNWMTGGVSEVTIDSKPCIERLPLFRGCNLEGAYIMSKKVWLLRQNIKEFETTVYHEFAHHLYYSYLNQTEMYNWDNISDDPISEYAKTSKERGDFDEDFSENFARYYWVKTHIYPAYQKEHLTEINKEKVKIMNLVVKRAKEKNLSERPEIKIRR